MVHEGVSYTTGTNNLRAMMAKRGYSCRPTVGQVGQEFGGHEGHAERHAAGQREGTWQMEDCGHASQLQVQFS
jgi:hypothetical protein